ncbi:ergothioneine biosynthesis protein EgtB [Tritonibacter aquimaris]|nr:ergothioneine biosynthesis protein EgtB [Tritonibacter aquimaris]
MNLMSPAPQPQIGALFDRTRARSITLTAPLSPEDMMLQSMMDASPAKWHLAHTTWFFEEFILSKYRSGYQSPDDRFARLFNSYYVQAGPRHARNQRGLISRPSVSDVLSYRAYVDEALIALIAEERADQSEIHALVELGCHHEMQHQELLVTDLLHGLSHNPLLPAYQTVPDQTNVAAPELSFQSHDAGLVDIGYQGSGFHYDCEAPRHKTYVAPFAIANRPVSNRDWIAFMEDGGYENAVLWLMDGFARNQREDWQHPLYWWQQDGAWWTFTLNGAQLVNLDAPVVHVSYYEADAFARWAGARLPTEAEHEIAFRGSAIDGNFMDQGILQPKPGAGIWGDVWEWTQSPFTPYPGFRPPEGAIGEYNGKFMVNQFVMRGGSCATVREQMRPSYRTFFYPHQRWQMMGLRLAKDL